MAKNHGNSVKNDRIYEALRDKGYSKERSAKIPNSGKKSSRKGGMRSHRVARYAQILATLPTMPALTATGIRDTSR